MRDLPIFCGEENECDQSLISAFLPCRSCGTGKMSSVPMGAFASFKVRDKMNSESDGKQGSSQQNTMKMTPPTSTECPDNPTKYTSKAMMAIWGMYNRYSVHNFKSNISSFDKV